MSKAFVKEDAENEVEDDEILQPVVPAGTKNYMTPAGAKRLQEELHSLKFKERAEVCAVVQWAAGNGDRSENGDYIYGKKRLREIDKRIRFLSKRLDNVEVVDPLAITAEDIRFGATVTFKDEDGKSKTYSIVGVDESDVAKGRISWQSPLGLALFKAKVGDYVLFRTPQGEREVEIIEILYKELP